MYDISLQAWNYTQATEAIIALLLALVPLQNFQILDFKTFQLAIDVPLTKWTGLTLSKRQFQAWSLVKILKKNC